MTILRGEYGHIKSRRDNHNRCIKCSSCSRESTCSTCSSWSDKTWKLALLESGTWLRRRRDPRKPCLIHQTKKNWMGSPLHMSYCLGEDPSRWQLQGYLYPEACKSTGQLATSQPAIGHSPNGQENITDQPLVKWALHKNFQVNQSPVTGHPATGHWT